MKETKHNENEEMKQFYEKWTASRIEGHDYLGDLMKCINLARLIPPKKNYKKILEIGCGCGNNLNYFGVKYNANITGTDIADYPIEFCKNNLKGNFIQHDIDSQNLPFEKDIFDLVILADVIEHVKNPERLMLEALRVGKEIIIKLPLQHRPRNVPDKNGHLYFWHYYTDALIWFKQFPMTILDYNVENRRAIYDIALYHKKGIIKKMLLLVRILNQHINIGSNKSEGICIYAIKREEQEKEDENQI